MKLSKGDILKFRVEHGCLLAGMTGVCRISCFEKSRRGSVVYIDTQNDDGSFFERFARFEPLQISFAPLGSSEFAVYTG